jgi:hypothetical protein
MPLYLTEIGHVTWMSKFQHPLHAYVQNFRLHTYPAREAAKTESREAMTNLAKHIYNKARQNLRTFGAV